MAVRPAGPPSRPPTPMVLLRTVNDAFHARVIAARLGADGIVTELRGSVGGPYPFGDVSVWVRPEDESTARGLLLADELEEVFDRPSDGSSEVEAREARVILFGLSTRQMLAALALVIVILAALGGRFLP